jgi:hypothetical protein
MVVRIVVLSWFSQAPDFAVFLLGRRVAASDELRWDAAVSD